MKKCFNLVREPWIPCIDLEGNRLELGIHDTLARAHELREVYDDSPLVTVCMLRLLFALTYRILCPSKPVGLWRSGRFPADSLSEYLNRWEDRFDLYHPQFPFYQDSTLVTKKESSIARLSIVESAGNNKILFDHRLDSDPSAATDHEIARVLLVIQTYATTGKLESGYPEAGQGFDKTLFFATGRNLYQTLLLNQPWQETDTLSKEDVPAWERQMPPRFEERTPLGHLDITTWQARRVLILSADSDESAPKRMAFDAGYRSSVPVFDSMALYSKDDTAGWKAYKFRESKALWRDLQTLLCYRSSQRVPVAVSNSALFSEEGLIDDAFGLDLSAIGLCAFQANISFWRHERMPLPLAYVRETPLPDEEAENGDAPSSNILACLRNLIRAAEEGAKILSSAERRLSEYIKRPQLYGQANGGGKQGKERGPSDVNFPGLPYYWSTLEPKFFVAYRQAPEDPLGTIEQWRKTIVLTVREAFGITTRSLDNSARSLKAMCEAERTLNGELKKRFQPTVKGV